MRKTEKWPDIQRFAEGGGAGAAGAGAGGAAGTAGAEGTPDAAGNEQGVGAASQQQPGPDKLTLFRDMITGEYKDEFGQEMQRIIDKRFAKSKQTEASLKAVQPIIGMLAEKYGVKPEDVDGLGKAIEADQSFWEEDAAKAGMSVEQYKNYKRIERENAQLLAAQRESANHEAEQQAMAALNAEVEEAKKFYPELDLEAELNDPANGAHFAKLLNSGIDVKTCYEVLHHDEIMMGAMQYAGQKAAQQVAASVRANRNRPPENGGTNTGAVNGAPDVAHMSKAERRALIERARSGERVVL